MGIFSWLVIGLAAGYIGSKLVNRTGEGLVRDSSWETSVRLSVAQFSTRSAMWVLRV